MLRVGLTGGIGSGKSTVAQRFTELGATVVDADALAREVVAPGTEGLAAVVRRFGPAVRTAAGGLDRQALGTLVFADERARADLEAITHPLIARRTAELVQGAPADGILVHDVPLLVEKRMGPGYHLVVVVEADPATRMARLVRRREMTQEEARGRMGAQASDEERRSAADVVLDNTSTVTDLRSRVDLLWQTRLVPFAHNLAHGIRVVRPEALVLDPPDPTWPEQAARLLDRLNAAFADTAVSADHVGSTAVPGLVAKDVIDLQVGVRPLTEADDPRLLTRLAAAGFLRAEGEWADVRGGQVWPKRMLGGCDPGRVVHIHVREAGGPGWRWALLFRDWLRADPVACEEYAVLKRSLAARHPKASDYAAAKEPWFEAAGERAEAWATEAGWEASDG